MGIKRLSAISGIAMLLSGAANAAIFDADSSGVFTAVVPPDIKGLEGINTNEIFWGEAPNNGPKSGYRFEGADVQVTDDSELFALGTFTHINNPIFLNPGSITQATLELTLAFGDGSEVSFFPTFNHNETPNEGSCAEGSNPCPDIITLGDPPLDQTIELGGQVFTLELFGFSQDGGIHIMEEFVTEEETDNTATLYGKMQPVPLPPALGLMGMALVSLVTVMRRKGTK